MFPPPSRLRVTTLKRLSLVRAVSDGSEKAQSLLQAPSPALQLISNLDAPRHVQPLQRRPLREQQPHARQSREALRAERRVAEVRRVRAHVLRRGQHARQRQEDRLPLQERLLQHRPARRILHPVPQGPSVHIEAPTPPPPREHLASCHASVRQPRLMCTRRILNTHAVLSATPRAFLFFCVRPACLAVTP